MFCFRLYLLVIIELLFNFFQFWLFGRCRRKGTIFCQWWGLHRTFHPLKLWTAKCFACGDIFNAYFTFVCYPIQIFFACGSIFDAYFTLVCSQIHNFSSAALFSKHIFTHVFSQIKKFRLRRSFLTQIWLPKSQSTEKENRLVIMHIQITRTEFFHVHTTLYASWVWLRSGWSGPSGPDWSGPDRTVRVRIEIRTGPPIPSLRIYSASSPITPVVDIQYY